MYDPSTGQFLQRDTYAGSAGNATSLNRYTYAGDAPTTSIDPSGHDPICIVVFCIDPGLLMADLFAALVMPGLGAAMATFDLLQAGVQGAIRLNPQLVQAVGDFAAPMIVALAVGLIAAPIVGLALEAIGITGIAAIILGGILVGAVSGWRGNSSAIRSMAGHWVKGWAVPRCSVGPLADCLAQPPPG